MRKSIFVAFSLVLLLLSGIGAAALTAADAKQAWVDAKKVSAEAQGLHKDAKLRFVNEPTPENENDVVDTGKLVLNDALDEVEAWLVWKDLEAKENTDVAQDIKDAISGDVEKNLAKVDSLRTDVAGIKNRFELGVVFLKMIGKYMELLTDVARNSGASWVDVGEKQADKAEGYEAKLRDVAVGMDDNGVILGKLDAAKDALSSARRNIASAEAAYKQVVLPGTPLLRFSEGNNYLRVARSELLIAHKNLNEAFLLMSSRGDLV
jgi:hypothetical protein